MSSAATARAAGPDLLVTAVRALAGVCDGAQQDDERGYAASDVPFGHRMAALPAAEWTPAMRREAWEMVRRYRGQLRAMGIEYDAIPEPPAVDRDGARQDARRALQLHNNRPSVSAEDGGFAIRFPYNAELVAKVREIPGRRWIRDQQDPHWYVPADRAAVEPLRAFVDAAQARTDDAVEMALQLLERQPAKGTLEVPAAPARCVTAADGGWELRFPYDRDMVAEVKRLGGARWDAKRKVWTVPAASAEALLVLLDPRGYEGVEQLRAAVQQARELREASSAADAELDLEGLGGTLRPFQRAGVAYATRTLRCFIADEMGLGKTVQALATIHALGAYPALVVCPASLRPNWQREAQKWLPGKRVVQVVNKQLPGCQARTLGDVLIINYDILNRHVDWLARAGLRAMVLDESHYIKNPEAQRTRAVMAIGTGVLVKGRGKNKQTEVLGPPVPVRLCLSGTPLLNRPLELEAQLEYLGRMEAIAGNTWQYRKRYCAANRTDFGWSFGGASNLDELNERLRATCYIRRNKADVLKELPPKIISRVTLPLSNRSEYDRAQRELIQWLGERAAADREFRASIAHLPPAEQNRLTRLHSMEAEEKAARAEQLVRISALKRLSAEGKLDAVAEWVEEFLATGEKLVLFAHHREVVDALAKRFGAPSITGDTPIPKRQAAVDAFQTDPNTRLIVLNLQAGGVGLTLTAASNVAFVELGWTPATHDQAEDRCHRIGQQDSVTAWYLLGEGTIDEEIAELIDAKRRVVDAATDGAEKAAAGSKSIMGALLRRLRGEPADDSADEEYDDMEAVA